MSDGFKRTALILAIGFAAHGLLVPLHLYFEHHEESHADHEDHHQHPASDHQSEIALRRTADVLAVDAALLSIEVDRIEVRGLTWTAPAPEPIYFHGYDPLGNGSRAPPTV